MLDILVVEKNIQKELKKLAKKLLKNLIVIEMSFPCNKKILAELRRKTIYALTCLVMKMALVIKSVCFSNLCFRPKI